VIIYNAVGGDDRVARAREDLLAAGLAVLTATA